MAQFKKSKANKKTEKDKKDNRRRPFNHEGHEGHEGLEQKFLAEFHERGRQDLGRTPGWRGRAETRNRSCQWRIAVQQICSLVPLLQLLQSNPKVLCYRFNQRSWILCRASVLHMNNKRLALTGKTNPFVIAKLE
jgi:hypothetical protein